MALANQVLLASAARTATGAGSAVDLGSATTMRVQLVVTAASGTTPTLNVSIQDTIDGTVWFGVASFTQVTAAGNQVLNITSPFTDRVRVSWVIAGTTPSFTFEVRTYTE